MLQMFMILIIWMVVFAGDDDDLDNVDGGVCS